MKSRLNRIRQLIVELESHQGHSNQEELCRRLAISKITLNRYISYLNSAGYSIEIKQGNVHLVNNGMLTEDPLFTKGDYVSFRLLMYIYNNNPCRRDRLRRYFCNSDAEECYEDKMSLRNMDMHIKKLIGLGYIEKFNLDNTLFYRATQNLLSSEAIPFDKAIQMYHYLNIYHRALPFQDSIQGILDKLGSSMTNYIRKSTIALEDMRLVCEVFPDCLMAKTNPVNDKLAKELEECCRQNIVLEILMASGSRLKVFPFCVVYNWNSGKWYLVYRHTSDDAGYDLARVDNICHIRSIGYNQKITREQLVKEKEDAQREVLESFAISIEDPMFVEVCFEGDEAIKSLARKRLGACNGKLIIDKSDRLFFSGYIEGRSDFMAWLRRFGTHATILSPKELRDDHLEDAMRALRRYNV